MARGIRNISFFRVKNPGQAAAFIAGKLSEHLDRQEKVLWLVPGGSAAEVAIGAAGRLDQHPCIHLLNVSLTDERYGPAGHPDSNWRQLVDKGFMLNGARLLPVLDNLSLEQAAEHYAKLLNDTAASAGYSLALGGMGADGHIFGIKPGSPAVDSHLDVVGYDWDDYRRLAPTAGFIRRIDEIIMYVTGSQKHRQLEMLSQEIEPAIQPAQLLKTMKRVTILNDWKGEDL